MNDVVGYVLVLAAIVIPAYALIRLAQAMLSAVFENQAVILSFPFA